MNGIVGPIRNRRSRPGTRISSLAQSRGQSLLEFAVVLPLLLLLMAGLIEFGRAFYQYNTLAKAVRQAARYMSERPYNATEIQNAQNMAVYGNTQGTGTPILPGLGAANITVTPRAGGTAETDPPRYVKVSVTGYTFQSMVPGIVRLNVLFTPGVEMRYVGLNAYIDQ
jgi:Flp pilus assembly protein TadG